MSGAELASCSLAVEKLQALLFRVRVWLVCLPLPHSAEQHLLELDRLWG